MIVSEIKLFELLKAKIGQQEAEAFVTLLETKVDKKFDEAKNSLATKNDMFALKSDIANLEVRMEIGFKDNLKWTIATIIACAGLILAFVKFIH